MFNYRFLLLFFVGITCGSKAQNENDVKAVKTKSKTLTQEQVELNPKANNCYLPLFNKIPRVKS